MPMYGSMSHDFTGRKIKKKSIKGEVYRKYIPREPVSISNRATPNFRRDAEVNYASADIGSPSVCTAPEKKEYTGTLIKGIGTLHKSNAVPIINEEEAKDLATMRRN